MNKKIAAMIVALMVVAMLAIPLMSAQAASYRGSWRKPPAFADYQIVFQTWSDPESLAGLPFKSYFTDEGDLVMKNFRCHGIPPLIDPWDTASWDDYVNGRGGIKLTIDGEYTLIGTVERIVKINVFYGFPMITGVYAIGKWVFEITSVESGEAPENAVGSTMSGWYTVDNDGNTYESTKGTGMFHGASMVFATTLNSYPVNYPTLPMSQLFTQETAEGNLLFP
jgi:hypothetical protein